MCGTDGHKKLLSKSLGLTQPVPTNIRRRSCSLKTRTTHMKVYIAEELHEVSQNQGTHYLSLKNSECNENYPVFLTHLHFPLQKSEAFSGKKQNPIYKITTISKHYCLQKRLSPIKLYTLQSLTFVLRESLNPHNCITW